MQGRRITEWYPELNENACVDGFTVLAFTKEAALQEILEYIDEFEFDGIEILGSWNFDDWETQEKLEYQTYY